MDDILRENDLHSKKNDSLSHYICRMGFCQTEEKRRWFISQELSLFDARYQLASGKEKQRINNELSNINNIDSNNIVTYETFDKKRLIESNLNGKSPILLFNENYVMQEESQLFPYHKVPFTHVFNLIGKKRVYLKNGYAYVPNNLFSTIIIGKFRSHISKSLILCNKSMKSLHNDIIAMNQISRIIHIINNLNKISNNPSYKSNNKYGEHFSSKDINQELVSKHFPLCMENSYNALIRDGHIKHGTRMCFGLFLKGIGMPYNESHLFFKRKFTKLGANKFEKEHRYTFRHMYGLEGKRTNYTAYGCNKLISSQPNKDDHFGCPFKLFDKNNLIKIFRYKKGMGNNDVNAIMEFYDKQHYQLACRKYFEIQHRSKFISNKNENKNIHNDKDFLATSIVDIESTWSHPNEYFDKSYKIYHPQHDGLGKGQGQGQQQQQQHGQASQGSQGSSQQGVNGSNSQ